jgi:MFS family permease
VRVYVLLEFFHTLAASLIWGINTLFLLDAGLSNTEAFAANAFFTAGMVLFEVPTGVFADTRGRRASYLLGTLTLIVSTLIYLWLWRVDAPFWAWALTSMFLGLGFTFFSGAVEAWLVDALKASGYEGKLEPVFAKGQIAEGIAMLGGALAGGFIAQATNLGVPYVIRAVVLAITFAIAFVLMRDLGFQRQPGKNPFREVKRVVRESIDHGLRNPPVRWVMLAAPFTDGVSIYAFYAAQPFLLELYGNPNAYGVAGIAAAIVAGAQILGGLTATRLHRFVNKRTTILIVCVLLSAVVLALIALLPRFYVAIALLMLWGVAYAAMVPVRQAYLNGLIESDHRATVLSFANLLGSGGGVIAQPLLGRAADVWSYSASYGCSAAIQALAAPFLWLARRRRAEADRL